MPRCFFLATHVADRQRDLALIGKIQTGWVSILAKGTIAMIKLTRLDGEPFVLNADLIRYVEKRPDTFITLTSGERIVVGETMDQVVDRAIEYQQRKSIFPGPCGPCVATP